MGSKDSKKLWDSKKKKVPADLPDPAKVPALVCHLKSIPVSASGVEGDGTLHAQGTLLSVECLTVACPLWNVKTSRCLDAEAREALIKMPAALAKVSKGIEEMEEFLRMPQPGGD